VSVGPVVVSCYYNAAGAGVEAEWRARSSPESLDKRLVEVVVTATIVGVATRGAAG
jgi:hypothetical protein